MKPLLLLGFALAGPTLADVQRIGPHAFTLPDGFEIRQVAATNVVHRPVNGAVDEAGRLYVTDSSGSTEPPAEQAKDPRWRVIRLEDSDGDGSYDRSVVFADRLPMLQGILWHSGSLYIGGSPAIWRLQDTDGDGRADVRNEWWNVGHPSTHCGNEVHGPYAGPDGFIYWTKGAFEPVSWTDGHGGAKRRDRASHIFRARPDGSGFESVMTGGMDNPVDVEFSDEGEAFFTSTFIDFSQPGWRDGIGFASSGAVFGKENSVLDDRAVLRAGPELAHPFIQMGAAAPSGLAAYRHADFGPGFQGNLFASAFNLRKVSRIELSRSGSAFAGKESDFVVSDNLDFHPTDVVADTDGSLLLLDTGGWYKLCCPSSQLWKADVLGGIYRVRRKGAAHVRGPAPQRPESPLARLRRLGDLRDPAAVAAARETLRNTATAADPFARRIAVTALGQLADKTAVDDVLGALEGQPDDALFSAGFVALTRIGDAAALRAALGRKDPSVRRAALAALDQLTAAPDRQPLQPAELLPRLTDPDSKVRQTAHWIASRHGDWLEPLAKSLEPVLRGSTESGGSTEDLSRLLVLVSTAPAGRSLIAETLGNPSASTPLRLASLEAMRSARPKSPPPEWVGALARVLEHSGSKSLHGAAISAASAIGAGKELASPLLRIGRDPSAPREDRIAAFATLPAGWTAESEDIAFLAGAVTARAPGAADALGHAAVSEAQLGKVLEAVRDAGPVELPRLLPAVERLETEQSATAFVRALATSKARAAIRPESLRAAVKTRPEAVKAEAERLLESLRTGRAAEQKHLAELKGALPEGDIRRGQNVFNSAKAACIQCHRLGYQGGDVGPDLTAIGTVRSVDDLLEAVVYPSAGFVRSYEPMTVATKDGEERTGIVRRDDERGVELVTGPGTSLDLRREDISEMRPSTVSMMPAGLEEQLTPQDLADLLAFLKNTKWGRN